MAPIEPRERGNRFLRRLDLLAGAPLARLSALYRFVARPAKNSNIETACVFCPGAVGDLILLTALLRGLRASAPTIRIELVVSVANAECASLLPSVDSIRAFAVSRPRKIIDYVRSRRYDLFIDACQWARLGNIVANLSGAGLCVGFATKGQFRGPGYDIRAPHRSDRHEYRNFLALGQVVWPELDGEPRLSLAAPPKPLDNLVYCHFHPAPGAGRELKMWPPAHWAALIRELLADDFRVELTGAAADARFNDDFLGRFFSGRAGVVSSAGKFSLPDLARRMSRGAGLVSVNTGVMHLGAVLGIPVVGLHGPTNPVRWGPIGPFATALLPERGENAYLNLGFEYPPSATNNMASLKPESAARSLYDLMKEREAGTQTRN